MEDKHFKELLGFMRGEDVEDLRVDQVKRILSDLMSGEFSGEISQHRFRITFMENTRTTSDVRTEGDRIILRLNTNLWDKGQTESTLKSILRHELLHVSSGLDDDDQEFKAEARRRGIDIWNV